MDKNENENRVSTSTALGLPGVQLYTIRSFMEADTTASLAEVARIGYKEVEFHNYVGLSASEICEPAE